MPIQNKDTTAASVPTPPLGSTTLFTESGQLKTKNDSGSVVTLGTGGTVTSVGISTNSGIGVSGSPVTLSGSIALDASNLTPITVAATGTVTGSNLSGTNTGDQTLNDLLPDQTGNSGKVLTTDGTDSSWTTASSGSVTSVTVNGSVGRITASGSPITSSGVITVDLAATAVTPASYTNADITIDQYGRITSAANGAGPVTPAGANTEIQFNNSGSFGADPGFTWDGNDLGLDGNLQLLGSGRLITGNTTNPIQNNRIAMQGSFLNGNSYFDVIPNGTSTFSGIRLFDNSDRTNASYLYAGVSSLAGYNFVGSEITGTGTIRGLALGVGSLRGVIVAVNGDSGLGQDSLIPAATSGHPYISAVAGAPTGIPSGLVGRAPIVIDDTNNQLYFYSNSSWRAAAAPNVGTATLVAGTVTVLSSIVTATSKIFLTVQSLGTVTVPTAVAISNVVAGVSFDIISASLTDTSVVAWSIV